MERERSQEIKGSIFRNEKYYPTLDFVTRNTLFNGAVTIRWQLLLVSWRKKSLGGVKGALFKGQPLSLR